MLRKLGYIAFLLGVGLLIFLSFLLTTEGMPREWEPRAFIGLLVLLIIFQMSFVVVGLRVIDYRLFTSTGSIDEYLLAGLDEKTEVKQLPLFWKIVGWFVIVGSLLVAIAGGVYFFETVFSFGFLDFSDVLISLYFLITAIASFIFSLRLVVRKWVEPVSG